MTKQRRDAYIDALADGQRPDPFDADPEDVDVLRTAISLRSARPGDGVPDEGFVGRLHQELVEQAEGLEQADLRIVPIGRRPKVRRRRSAIAAIAAGLVLVGGAAAITEAVDQGAATPAAVPAPHGSSLRTGTFETTDGRVMGQIVVSRGNPSWVFLNVGGANYTGTIVCKLQVADGSTVATGAFMLHGGKGVLSKTIQVDVGRLRGAKLVTPTGAVVASATFA
jgi:hypothetical protein